MTRPLKIGILGYGKMGKAVDAIATSKGHEIAWRVDAHSADMLHAKALRSAEVVIEFTQPEAAKTNLMRCIEVGVPVVSGTTGWQHALPEVEAYCQSMQGAMLWASNFSVGVNLFFAINRYAAQLLGQFAEYAPMIEETHHVHKRDAPSGTAISLAQDLMSGSQGRFAQWTLRDAKQPRTIPSDAIPIQAIRQGEVPGTHNVIWEGPNDCIALKHEAFNRQGFAAGAVLAAEWIYGRQGVFSMRDVLNI